MKAFGARDAGLNRALLDLARAIIGAAFEMTTAGVPMREVRSALRFVRTLSRFGRRTLSSEPIGGRSAVDQQARLDEAGRTGRCNMAPHSGSKRGLRVSPSRFRNRTLPCCLCRTRPTSLCAEPRSWPTMAGVFPQVTAVLALVVAWCLLAAAAIVTASLRRFEGACMYFMAAGVAVGFAIVTANLLAP
jgi:hypothetical protein